MSPRSLPFQTGGIEISRTFSNPDEHVGERAALAFVENTEQLIFNSLGKRHDTAVNGAPFHG